MYARLISFSGADPEKRESAIEMIRGTVIPMLQNYDGYGGYLALYDEHTRKAKAIILWDSKDAADAAEETLEERRQKMVDQVGLTIESVELYEATVLDMATARV
ncbi:MAG: hypothetical protein QOG06_1007 [Gaiellaceae bacterium]|jgi:hypothetical protein|nr:hypothetical protein [Gaiellaceae bacterium]MEA2390230.1 hypothetical protein [Solirubrobacteraceae bacterium]